MSALLPRNKFLPGADIKRLHNFLSKLPGKPSIKPIERQESSSSLSRIPAEIRLISYKEVFEPKSIRVEYCFLGFKTDDNEGVANIALTC